jgi:hypothetical protein
MDGPMATLLRALPDAAIKRKVMKLKQIIRSSVCVCGPTRGTLIRK